MLVPLRTALRAAIVVVVACSDSVAAQRPMLVQRTPGDTLANTYRLSLPTGTPLGLVVVLSNWGQQYRELDWQRMAIQEPLTQRGIAVLELSNTPWRNNYLADAPLEVLDTILGEVMTAHRIPPGQVILGGLQMAGTGALRYAQRCARSLCPSGQHPIGVFAVDPVLDFTRYYEAQSRYLTGPSPVAGARGAVLGSMRRELGGRPAEVPERYRQNSVLSLFDSMGGNAHLLRNTAVRIYMEPSIDWHMAHADNDYLTSNLADAAGLVYLLRRFGNMRAELLGETGRAVLPDGRPSAHAWSIIDEAALVQWAIGLLAPAPDTTVAIPGGNARIGTDAADVPELQQRFQVSRPELFSSELPRTTLRLAPFRMMRHEVTNIEFSAFVAANPAWGKSALAAANHNGKYLQHWDSRGPMPADARLPVTFITWQAANAFCTWRGMRLPTEAEWEHAAKGGAPDAEFPWGNANPTAAHARWGGSETEALAPVGSYPANGFGLFDMAGNVWEFTADFWRDRYDAPAPADTTAGARRVIRGGSFQGAAVNLRTRYRDSHPAFGAGEHVGFRCAQ